MNLREGLASLFCLAAATFGGCVADGDEPVFSLAPGDTLPRFEVEMNDGTTISNTSLTGAPAEIIFFSTTCPDCRRHLPELEKEWQAAQATGDPTAYICIARAESAPSIAAFWAEHGLTMPWSAQPNDSVYKLFASSIIPRVYSVSPEGIITRVRTDADMDGE